MRHFHRLLPLLLLNLCLGCTALTGWGQKPATQAVIAEGCQAAMIDDNRANATANMLIPYPEVKLAINTAHAAIQQALQQCVDTATAAARGG